MTPIEIYRDSGPKIKLKPGQTIYYTETDGSNRILTSTEDGAMSQCGVRYAEGMRRIPGGYIRITQSFKAKLRELWEHGPSWVPHQK